MTTVRKRLSARHSSLALIGFLCAPSGCGSNNDATGPDTRGLEAGAETGGAPGQEREASTETGGAAGSERDPIAEAGADQEAGGGDARSMADGPSRHIDYCPTDLEHPHQCGPTIDPVHQTWSDGANGPCDPG